MRIYIGETAFRNYMYYLTGKDLKETLKGAELWKKVRRVKIYLTDEGSITVFDNVCGVMETV